MTETNNPKAPAALPEATGSAVICDIIGCHEHATGEMQVGDEYIPLCEMHRKSEMDRLMPKWRPLPPNAAGEPQPTCGSSKP